MAETNQNPPSPNQTDPNFSGTAASHQTEPNNSGTAKQGSKEDSNKPWLGMPISIWLAIAGGLGTALGAGLTSLGEVVTSYWEFDAQFRQGRQEFEFELIREALEVQASSQSSDEEEPSEDSEGSEEANNLVRLAQDIKPGEEDSSDSLAEKEEQDRLRAAKELEFYADIGIIQSLDAQKVKEWATEREAELPRLQNSNAQNTHASSNICYFVLESVNVYGSPSFDSPISVNYAPGDIAHASYPFTYVMMPSGSNGFVKVNFFGGNQGWIPSYSSDLSTKILELYPPEDCEGLS